MPSAGPKVHALSCMHFAKYITRMKRCNRCRESKTLDQFYSREGGRDGKSAICIECEKAKQRDRYHTDEYRKWNRERRARNDKLNPDKARETHKAYYFRNRDIILDRNRTIYSPQKTARQALWTAYESGKIQKPQHCEQCGEKTIKLHAHHADYSKPLSVKWLCYICHGVQHLHGTNTQNTLGNALNPGSKGCANGRPSSSPAPRTP